MPQVDRESRSDVRLPPWPELDALRGLAVAAMVANHAVAALHTRAFPFSEFGELLFILGGFAPVLFFFTTGFGSGLQSLRAASPARGGGHRYGLGRKLAILVFADQFMLWRFNAIGDGHALLGLDFLGFVALSTAVLEPLRRARRATDIALLAAAVVLVVRFILSPWWVPNALDATDLRWVGVVTGRAAVEGIAYPPLPWLVYPFLGFALGRTVGASRAALEGRSVAVVFAAGIVGVLGVAASQAFAAAGWEVSRYGVHSLAYLPLAIGALGGACAASWLLCRTDAQPVRWLREFISVRGLASLAVVPIHFALINEVKIRFGPKPDDATIAVLVLVLIVVALVGGRLFSKAAERLAERGYGPVAFATSLVVVAVITTGLLAPFITGKTMRIDAAALAQLGLCGLLVWNPRTRTSSPPVAAGRED